MNFQPINKEAEATFKGIERRIFRLQSGGTIDSLRTIGADTSGQIGASFVSLKQLASCYAPDETLALLLWQRRLPSSCGRPAGAKNKSWLASSCPRGQIKKKLRN